MKAPEILNIGSSQKNLSRLFVDHINNKDFPCIAARSSVHEGNIRFFEATHIACPHDDKNILEFLYQFVDDYRKNSEGFVSAVVIFKEPEKITEELFEMFLWKRLQSLHELDRINFSYDDRVNSDPGSAKFSFSLKQEAFFIIGMHPGNSRPARQFCNPAIVFNPHDQFEKLKTENRYEKIKAVVRKRDEKISGTINPMLSDFGERSEAFQYSGKSYESDWQCPLNIKNE